MLSSIQMLDVNSHKPRDGDCLYFSVCVCAYVSMILLMLRSPHTKIWEFIKISVHENASAGYEHVNNSTTMFSSSIKTTNHYFLSNNSMLKLLLKVINSNL